MNQLLIVEDDEGLNRGIRFYLEKEGYTVTAVNNLHDARILLKGYTPDLILLDLNLPDGDGLKLCREVKEKQEIPVIMLTARDLEIDEVLGFESGADDYITKPFSLSILKVRINAMLRRKKQWLSAGELKLSVDSMKAYKGTDELELSVTEYKILKILLEHQGQAVTKEQILAEVWDKDNNFVEENTLPVNIRRLRLKIEKDPANPEWIHTVHGRGYCLEKCKEEGNRYQ